MKKNKIQFIGIVEYHVHKTKWGKYDLFAEHGIKEINLPSTDL